MKKIIVVSISLLICSSALKAKQITKLTEEARISVITMGPDKDELYSAFGHNAIRVFDPALGIDIAYNYGTFNYNDPEFYINFTKGYLLYFLSVGEFSQLMRFYEYYDRFVHEQDLDFSPAEVQRVYEYLENNLQPDNASYFYDYFYDNCATRIRDVFVDVFSDSIRFDLEFAGDNLTVRALTDLYLEDKFPWGDLGIDICLGLPMDSELTAYDFMFLPDFIESSFDHAFLLHESGVERPLVNTSRILNQSSSVPVGTFFTPLLVFSFLLFIGTVITWLQWRLGIRGKWLDFSWFFILGLVGLLLLGLWVFTDHAAASRNYNLLWAFPLHAFAAFLIFKPSSIRKKYFSFVGWGLLVLILIWDFLPQDLHYALIPITIFTMMRAFYIGHSYAYNHENI